MVKAFKEAVKLVFGLDLQWSLTIAAEQVTSNTLP